MSWITKNLWLIPILPLLAAALISVCKQPRRRTAATLAIGSMVFSFLLSCCAFATTLHSEHGGFREVANFDWFSFGTTTLRLGWVLDPLTACMLVMVTFVGTLIFIYSIGYMAHDENFTRFFCFLALFAAAMLGILIANNLLLLFISWELVGLASYLLIGFWFHKPSAAAAAKKAFITTRIGDIGFFIGILWLYSSTGTLLFYDNGAGCLESSALTKLVTETTFAGMAVSTAIAILIFCGAIGKSGQVPLHVWLPDAMEGPTPVSALIHAATMVAAGVFLVARVYPLMEVTAPGLPSVSTALQVVTWIGAITAVFAALIAVAQNDIKRILAYSTVSQLGFMMMGLGMGGVAVGMFHLITHAFFKSLLFLGAGSIIHGCHEEQDIRHMGGLKKYMPLTFATYAIGMMALSGVPFFFSGFWSKDEILHSAFTWQVSKIPFYLAAFGALLTAFYMTRQICYAFFGSYRGHKHPHESPRVMTVPLVLLAIGAIVLGVFGTPAWPAFETYLSGHDAEFDVAKLLRGETLSVMLISICIVAVGIFAAWQLYGRKPVKTADQPDPLEAVNGNVYRWLANRLYIDEFYDATVIRLNAAFAYSADLLDRVLWGGAVRAASLVTLAFAHINRTIDDLFINFGFDESCHNIRRSSGFLSKLQDGQIQNYLRGIGVALATLVLFLIWGCR
ncbi:MAG: dehydrogenase subunit [Verrucomicrobiales bacterium]|nr:dehydrogenase subunit [Verrucomicrobiales bacterium]